MHNFFYPFQRTRIAAIAHGYFTFTCVNIDICNTLNLSAGMFYGKNTGSAGSTAQFEFSLLGVGSFQIVFHMIKIIRFISSENTLFSNYTSANSARTSLLLFTPHYNNQCFMRHRYPNHAAGAEKRRHSCRSTGDQPHVYHDTFGYFSRFVYIIPAFTETTGSRPVMIHPKQAELARLLVTHSVALKKGEKCLIQSHDVPEEMIEALINEIYEVGAYPVLDYRRARLQRALLKGASVESLTNLADIEAFRMKKMDAFIGIRGYDNPRETGDLPESQSQLEMTHLMKPVHHEIRVPGTKWVVLRYPTPGMAAMAQTSTSSFEDFYFAVTTQVDYAAMAKAMEPARAFLEKTKKVHITGPGTDLRFSIESIPVVPCFGERNIPDGEIYTAPVRDSVEGTISYNAPSSFFGHTYQNIRFSFENGRIIEAASDDTGKLNAILDTDEGSRYIGEFALGCNPRILEPMDETLFDEKIAGSFHFTPGNAYTEADNGNRSAIHWDLVCIQRPEYGGGEISMDGQLIRKDGIFVHPAFEALNPKHLTR